MCASSRFLVHPIVKLERVGDVVVSGEVHVGLQVRVGGAARYTSESGGDRLGVILCWPIHPV